jgi:PAS domain S-box-containing protein
MKKKFSEAGFKKSGKNELSISGGKEVEKLSLIDDKFRALFDFSPGGVLLEDNNGNILDANDTLCKMFGYSREELIGQNVRILVPPEKLPEVDSNIQRILSGEVLEHIEVNYKKNGSLCYIKLRERQIGFSGDKKGI